MRLSNAKCVVTGGASGIGAATARLMISRGVKVVGADLNAGALADMQAEIGSTASLEESEKEQAGVEKYMPTSREVKVAVMCYLFVGLLVMLTRQ